MSFKAPVSAGLQVPGNPTDFVYGILKPDAIFSDKSFPVGRGRCDSQILCASVGPSGLSVGCYTCESDLETAEGQCGALRCLHDE